MFGVSSVAPAYQFFAHGREDILPRLTHQLLALDPSGGAKVQACPEDYSVQASLVLPGASFELEEEGGEVAVVSSPGVAVELAVHVFQAEGESEGESEEEVLLVTVHRKAGAITAFQKCFMALRDQTLREGEGEGCPLGEEGAGGKYEEQEEQELSEELDMI